MKRIVLVLPLVVLLLAGCASAPRSLNADHPAERAQIERRLSEIFDAGAKKDFERLDSYHFYGPKFTKFAGDSLVRQDAETARQGEHVGLAAINGLTMRAEELKIDVFGGTAIATFVLDYSFKSGTETVGKKAAGTLVFIKDAGEWKITHEHFSASRTNP